MPNGEKMFVLLISMLMVEHFTDLPRTHKEHLNMIGKQLAIMEFGMPLAVHIMQSDQIAINIIIFENQVHGSLL